MKLNMHMLVINLNMLFMLFKVKVAIMRMMLVTMSAAKRTLDVSSSIDWGRVTNFMRRHVLVVRRRSMMICLGVIE